MRHTCTAGVRVMAGRPASGVQRCETRWDGPRIRVWLPARSYRRAAVTVWLAPAEAEALVRNLGRRLAERPAADADAGR